jgi:hypothetical protein
MSRVRYAAWDWETDMFRAAYMYNMGVKALCKGKCFEHFGSFGWIGSLAQLCWRDATELQVGIEAL